MEATASEPEVIAAVRGSVTDVGFDGALPAIHTVLLNQMIDNMIDHQHSASAFCGIGGARHRALARQIRQRLAQYAKLKDIISMLGRERRLADAPAGCERILQDEFNDRPETALYLTGVLSDAKGKPATSDRQVADAP
jgi:F0F1-type ATP synthase beta subunit